MATNPAVRVPEPSVESSVSGVHWGAITAGALGAVGITFVLISLGPATREHIIRVIKGSVRQNVRIVLSEWIP